MGRMLILIYRLRFTLPTPLAFQGCKILKDLKTTRLPRTGAIRPPLVDKGSAQYFRALDGFRGALAVFVAIYHTSWLSYINSTRFLDNGTVIIDLFFALSGFLMFILYSQSLSNGLEVRKFLTRRFARLYPLHLFTLFMALGYCVFRLLIAYSGLAETEPGESLPFQPGSPNTLYSFMMHVFLLHSMGVTEALSFNVPSWTISVEFFTYIVFAGVTVFARPHKAWHFLCITMGCFLIYFALSHVKPNMNITYDYGFFRCMAGFFLGGVAAFLFSKSQAIFAKLSFLKKTALEGVVIAGSTAFVIYCPGKLQFFVGPILLIFITVFAFDGGAISKFMSHKFFAYLAKISYSIYMVHFVIALMFGILLHSVLPLVLGSAWEVSQGTGDLFLLPYLAVVIGVSHLTQRYVEVPGGKWVSKFSFWQGGTRLLERAIK